MEGGYGGVTLVQAENKLGTLYHIQGETVVGVCGMCVLVYVCKITQCMTQSRTV